MKPSSLTFGIIGAIACVLGAILFEVLFPAKPTNAPENSRVAVALLIDTSGSMEQEGKLEEVKRAAGDYVARQSGNAVIAGMSITRFSSDARTVSGYSRDYGYHQNVISQFTANGATEMAGGLETAARSLDGAETGTTRLVLLFTDGEPGSNIEPAEIAKPRTLAVATALRVQGVRLVAVGTLDADIGFLSTLTGDRSLVFPTSAGNFAAAFSQADAKIRNLFSGGAGGSRGFGDALLLGALVTLFLGGALLIAENTLGLRGRWWRDLFWVLPMSALLGVGGALLGQALFAIFGDAARVVGWAVVGTIAGAVLGLADRSRAKAVRGAIGGTVGGVVGGIVFSALGGAFSSGALELLGRLLGFAALGFAVGLMLQLVQQALKTAWLTGITTGVYEGKQYILGKPIVTVGRSDGNDIGLYREKNLALKLGAFKFTNGRWRYEGDPVPINGNPSGSAVLVNGDTIKLGATEFLFENKGDSSSPSPQEVQTQPQSTVHNPQPTAPSVQPQAQSAPPPAPLPVPKPWRLVGTETLELPFGTVTLGRGEQNRIVLQEASVSTEHARLELILDSLTVTDLDSTNGTFVDGQQLPANQPFVVQEGAKLTFGAVEFRVSR
jgi:pSer/pThr/pTyr-binding forkhead associated (FHA) protein/uncharacterized protein YegL